jgi:hypothetical protein
MSELMAAIEASANAPWHRLYFFPLPHGHGALRPILAI